MPSAYGLRVYRTENGNASVIMDEWEVAAEEDLAIGDPIVFDSTSGLITRYAGGDDSCTGVAMENMTGAAGVTPTISFIPASDNLVFSVKTSENTSATPSAAMVGKTYDMEGNSGAMTLDTDDTTGGAFRVIGLEEGETWGKGCRVLVKLDKRY